MNNPLIVGAIILFGLMAFGRLFQPTQDQRIVIIREQPHDSVRGGGCGSLLLTAFLALLLLLLLTGGR
jgi:hypothetical protein